MTTAAISAIMIMMSKREGKTTIQITKETADKLATLGKKGESYEDIILKLLKKAVK